MPSCCLHVIVCISDRQIDRASLLISLSLPFVTNFRDTGWAVDSSLGSRPRGRTQKAGYSTVFGRRDTQRETRKWPRVWLPSCSPSPQRFLHKVFGMRFFLVLLALAALAFQACEASTCTKRRTVRVHKKFLPSAPPPT